MSSPIENVYSVINKQETDKKLFCDLLHAFFNDHENEKIFISGLKKLLSIYQPYLYFDKKITYPLYNILNNMLPYPEESWVQWYVESSDCGIKECKAAIDGVEYKIITPEDLWDFCYDINKYNKSTKFYNVKD